MNKQLVKAWKDPEYRATLMEVPEHPAGMVSEEELRKMAGGVEASPHTHPITIPISLAICPTTTCASFSKPCP